MISEKINILQTDSRGKNFARKYMTLYVGGKNFITRGLEEINLSYTNQITNTSPSPFKSQMVGPLAMELNANCNTTFFPRTL